MSWEAKILNRDYTKVVKTWNGASFDEVILGPADFVLNITRRKGTWREVSYTPLNNDVDLVRRISTSSDIIMTVEDKPFQFIEPLVEEIYLTLPDPPIFNQRYIIKNLSEINNVIHVRGTIGGPTIYTLDSTDEYSNLFHDGIEWHIQI